MHFGEDAGAADPAAREDETASPYERRIVGRHAEHAQCEVRLDRGAQLAAVAVGELPAAVRALLTAEVPLRTFAREPRSKRPQTWCSSTTSAVIVTFDSSSAHQ